MRISYPIETARLQLTPFTAADGDALYALESDPDVKRFAGGVLTRAQSDLLLARFVAQVAESSFGAVAITQRAGGIIIGLCGLYRDGAEAELFFGLARHVWGQGLATEACCGLLNTALQLPSLQRIVAHVDHTNTRSIRVLERIGMDQVAVASSSSTLSYAANANTWTIASCDSRSAHQRS
jgi:RimJ/RimL family protein N-acetyltransferase